MTALLGRDIYCFHGPRTGVYASGLLLLAQNVGRRFRTPRGSLRGGPEEAAYGLDLLGRLGSLTDDTEAAALEGLIVAECAKDRRIQETIAKVSAHTENGETTWTIDIECITAEGNFRLAVTEATIELVGLNGGTA